MTLHPLKIGEREFVLLPKHDFEKLAARAKLADSGDEYWTKSTLNALPDARAHNEQPIPFNNVERQIKQDRSRPRVIAGRRSRG